MVKYKKIKSKKGIPMIEEALTEMYKMEPALLQTMEPIIQMEEYAWLTSHMPVYFFEDADLAKNISRSASNIKDVSVLHDGTETFMLAMPNGYSENDFLSGLLVTVANHAARSDDYKEKFFPAIGLPIPKINFNGEMGDFTVSINYRAEKQEVWSRCTLPSQWIGRILEINTKDEYKRFMKSESHFKCFDKLIELTDNDIEEQFEIAKLVCGFLVYRRSLPQRFESGLPSRCSFGTKLTSKASYTKVKPPAIPQGSETPVSTHYRSWHFRQLIHDKYYRGEHKDKAQGSRILFIQDSIVNNKTTNKTARSENVS